jgi:hypothetical protein
VISHLVYMYAARPAVTLLAMATASASVSKATIGAIGPNCGEQKDTRAAASQAKSNSNEIKIGFRV